MWPCPYQKIKALTIMITMTINGVTVTMMYHSENYSPITTNLQQRIQRAIIDNELGSHLNELSSIIHTSSLQPTKYCSNNNDDIIQNNNNIGVKA